MKKIQNGIIATMILFSLWANDNPIQAQGLRIPQNQNISNSVGRRLGVTEIDIKWNAPGVKGREGKIWGTTIAHYGFMVLGFGSNVESPWRAGADEGTTMSFSTDVRINGQPLAAGTYNFSMPLPSAHNCMSIKPSPGSHLVSTTAPAPSANSPSVFASKILAAAFPAWATKDFLSVNFRQRHAA